MINLVLMRHGDAEPQFVSDALRQLTPQGIREVEQMAAYFAANAEPFDYIISSPFVRAVQTAELMLAQQPTSTQRQQIPELVPEGDSAQVQLYVDALLSLKPKARVLLVSHMPLVSFLVERFTQPGKTPIFATASCALVQYQAGQGELVQLLTPDQQS